MDDGVQMDVPFTGSQVTDDFDRGDTAGDRAFPETGLSESAEGGDETGDSDFEGVVVAA
jgi:hypothetical protein